MLKDQDRGPFWLEGRDHFSVFCIHNDPQAHAGSSTSLLERRRQLKDSDLVLGNNYKVKISDVKATYLIGDLF